MSAKYPLYGSEKYKKTKLNLEQNTRKSSSFRTQPSLPAYPTTNGRARPTVYGRSLFANALCATEPTSDGRLAYLTVREEERQNLWQLRFDSLGSETTYKVRPFLYFVDEFENV
ncbi:hypothetical protein M9H77_06906 [Catharanthus roseus]|uniref:Uncharacterized protein n=1 Tax=Catharanthus roseus TaxID=4058 RepID=A0ACC0BTN0_CATRO|nr:hypothetical protein M9H77_06906 [Catharanthus roseus]